MVLMAEDDVPGRHEGCDQDPCRECTIKRDNDEADRTEHQNTPQTAKVDRVARIAADGTGCSRIMAQMALDEFVVAYWRKS